MRAHGVILGLSPLFILLAGAAVDGCGGTTPPALGLEGAGCYSDGSCNSQLVCLAKVCRRPAAGSTAGAGGGTAGAGGADGGAGRDAATDIATAADSSSDGAAGSDGAATEAGHDASATDSGDGAFGDGAADGLVEGGSDASCAPATCAANAPWSDTACACVPIVGSDGGPEVGGDGGDI